MDLFFGLVAPFFLSIFFIAFCFFIFNIFFILMTILYNFFFILSFLLNRVADKVLVLQPGVKPVPLRWKSRVQDIGP